MWVLQMDEHSWVFWGFFFSSNSMKIIVGLVIDCFLIQT